MPIKGLGMLARIVVIILAVVGTIAVVLFAIGYRPVLLPDAKPDWSAIGALGEWDGVLVAVFIPLAAIYIERKFKESVNAAQEQTIKELVDFRTEYEEKLKVLASLIDPNGSIVIDGGEF